ncbi:MAG: flavodoxin family protein [Defluviitaleaceae bacterium]|nr:flavodoxin family protein [Defluviitaleaceae bacterium]
MKVLAINGSPRHSGNTFNMLSEVLAVCKEAGLETELYQAGGREIRGCRHCGACSELKKCVIGDWINDVYDKMKEADAIILGSPTYFFDLTPEIKAIIDRCGFVNRRDNFSLSRKIGAAVSAVRRAGGVTTLDSIQHFFLINDMIVPGSTYLNVSLSMAEGDYAKDEEGIRTMKRLAENIVWLLEKTKG